jgi:hypothetical protein
MCACACACVSAFAVSAQPSSMPATTPPARAAAAAWPAAPAWRHGGGPLLPPAAGSPARPEAVCVLKVRSRDRRGAGRARSGSAHARLIRARVGRVRPNGPGLGPGARRLRAREGPQPGPWTGGGAARARTRRAGACLPLDGTLQNRTGRAPRAGPARVVIRLGWVDGGADSGTGRDGPMATMCRPGRGTSARLGLGGVPV